MKKTEFIDTVEYPDMLLCKMVDKSKFPDEQSSAYNPAQTEFSFEENVSCQIQCTDKHNLSGIPECENSTVDKNYITLAVALKLFSSKVTVRFAVKNANDFIFYMPVIGHNVSGMSLHQYDETQKETHKCRADGLRSDP